MSNKSDFSLNPTDGVAINKPLDWIDILSRDSGHGAATTAHVEAMSGINVRGYGSTVPHNTDDQGLVLFTRPLLNLSYDNLSSIRELTPLLTSRPETYQYYIREVLDPLMRAKTTTKGPKDPDYGESTLFDRRMPFIPLLTNHLKSSSGWPDLVLGTFTSEAGITQEEYSLPDGPIKVRNTWSMTCNYRNVQGDPITMMMAVWTFYMHAVYSGIMVPYPEMIARNQRDYDTAIYRLVLNDTRTYVQGIARTIAFPTTVPMGAKFNYDSTQRRVADNDDLSFNFQCHGAEYNDPVLFEDFNKTVLMFNPDLSDERRASTHRRISAEEMSFLKYSGFPLINSLTHELTWWIPNDVYNRLVGYRITR